MLGILDRYRFPVRSCGKDYQKICKAICSGFFTHTARRTNDGYVTLVDNQTVSIHPSSALFQKNPEMVVYHELVFTTKEFMRQIVEIKSEWLVEIAPHYYKKKDVEDDAGKKMPKVVGKAAS